MTSQITYFVPKASSTSKDINFDLDTDPFKSQFKLGSPPHDPIPTTGLMAMALNSGYGAVPTELFTPTAVSWWRHMRRYLIGRLSLANRLISRQGTPPTIQSVIPLDLLEKTESGDLATLFGMIFCRAAAEIWATRYQGGAKITRFWHVQIAKDNATKLDITTDLFYDDALNPDYVFELDGKNWFSLEAKGTFGPKRWTFLQPGLKQASKILSISFINPATNFRYKRNIKSYACTLCYFDSQRELQVIHVDPPSNSEERDTNEGSISPILVKEFADLVKFEQSFAQFSLLGSDFSSSQLHEIPFSDRFTWKLLIDGETFRERIYIGLPSAMDNFRDSLRTALLILRSTVPLCNALKNSSTSDISKAADICMSSLASGESNASEQERFARDKVLEIIQYVMKGRDDSEKKSATILKEVAEQKLLTSEDETQLSVLQLHRHLRNIVKVVDRYARMNLELWAKEEERPDLTVTDNGLIVSSGIQFTPPSARFPKVKI
ncbi:hypothetical protein [Herbaspirillum camelliae]|uniref:hypothetical protein n=1 Tax=Herbaspirillum camelliae TaxID=1892903 RepID=UPI000ABB598C|nr:hypothetical protein [Herbaspirillum camelliae]